MGHHAVEMTESMKKIVDEMQLGATHQFPMGKLNEKDEGEIKIAIGVENNKVVINFGTPVSWIGFSREQALDIVNSLADKAFSIPKAT